MKLLINLAFWNVRFMRQLSSRHREDLNFNLPALQDSMGEKSTSRVQVVYMDEGHSAFKEESTGPNPRATHRTGRVRKGLE